MQYEISPMQQALLLAREALDAGEVPVGAVIVRNGQIIARARNRREMTDATAHAEILAISEACRTLGTHRLTDCVLYVTLEPCPMCAGAIAMARLGGVVYGAADRDMGCCGSLYDFLADPALYPASGGPIPCVGQVLAEESAQLLQEFFRKKRQKA